MTQALQQIEFEVDGEKYRTSQLSATEGRGLFLKLVKAMAPALNQLLLTENQSLQQMSMMSAAADILQNLDASLLDELCDKFGDKTVHVVAENKTPKMDRGYFGLHFAARYPAMVKWLISCCQANGLSDFLPGR